MNVPMSWLKEYVDIDVSLKEFMDSMTMTGTKVEGAVSAASEIKNVVVGKVCKLEKHPHADKLFVVTVDIGKEEPIIIVTGATNLYEGACVPVALDGATLAGGVTIQTSDFRGVLSYGMLCSVEELGCDRHDFPEAPEHGIYIFPYEVKPGEDAAAKMDIRDDVVEFEITPNRADCYSILGIAREAAATFDKEFRYPKISENADGAGMAGEMLSVEIEAPDLCPRYAARLVKNVKIAPSPRWMRKRLRLAGVRPINNIVDITNYVMLEMGQPMHAFDIDCIDERRIIVRRAFEGEEITTLDGNRRKLDSSMLVIADPNKALGIAGIMGGENSMISGKAEAILFESANFFGPGIRKSAKKLGLRTEASGKFEKGLDPNIAFDAVERAVQLVELLNAGEVVPGIIDSYPNKREPRVLSYTPERINSLLGTDIAHSEMVSLLEKLEIKVDAVNFKATVPTFRADMEGVADIAEEVGRLYGYGKIEATLASGTSTAGKKTREQKITAKIKDIIIANGFSEIMCYSFESPKVLDMLNIPKESELRSVIKIFNPLGEDFSIMRTVTLNGMLQSLATNFNRRNEEAKLFEVGKIYIPKSLPLTELPDEPPVLTLGAYGSTDFYDMKGVVEALLTALGITDNIEFSPETGLPWMHPGRTAEFSLNGAHTGYIGEVHPDVAEKYGIGAKAYVAVIDMRSLIENTRLIAVYKPLPKFPAVTRDIAMLIKESVLVKDIENTIKENGGEFLEEIKLFDVYKGAQIAFGFKSVAFSMTFRSADRTLKDEETSEAVSNITSALEKRFGAVLRDK